MYIIYTDNNRKRNTTDDWNQAVALAEIYRKSGAKVWIEDQNGKVYE